MGGKTAANNNNNTIVLHSHQCSEHRYIVLCARTFSMPMSVLCWYRMQCIAYTEPTKRNVCSNLCIVFFCILFYSIWSFSISGYTSVNDEPTARFPLRKYLGIVIVGIHMGARLFVWCRRIFLSSALSGILFSCFLRRVSRPPAQPIAIQFVSTCRRSFVLFLCSKEN